MHIPGVRNRTTVSCMGVRRMERKNRRGIANLGIQEFGIIPDCPSALHHCVEALEL